MIRYDPWTCPKCPHGSSYCPLRSGGAGRANSLTDYLRCTPDPHQHEAYDITIACLLTDPYPTRAFTLVCERDMSRFSYPPEATVLLAPDSDCCKIFTDKECELVQRVPPASEAISQIGSTDPAAMLFDAAAAFEEGDPRADEVILTATPK